jgi:phage gp16-like protein
MLAKVHLAAKELRLDEDARRDVLERLTGHRSSADCSDAQLDQVLAHFRSLGWSATVVAGGKPARHAQQAGLAHQPKPADHPVAKKARAMWISLWNLGVVDHGSESALEAFAKRQLRVDRLQWADQSQGYRLIEALKAMAERNGWSQHVHTKDASRQPWFLKARLVNAQAQKLGRPSLVVAGKTEAELDRIAREQGIEIRAAKAAGA